MAQLDLGDAYGLRIRGDRAENLERAIGHLEQAFTVYTQEGSPVQWAWTQHGLGNAYSERIRGDRARNLEPRRVFRRPIWLSHAALATSSAWA
jgi:hypothetical protein